MEMFKCLLCLVYVLSSHPYRAKAESDSPVYLGKGNATTARERCTVRGMYLPTDQNDADLSELMKRENLTSSWLNLFREDSDTWETIDGPPVQGRTIGNFTPILDGVSGFRCLTLRIPSFITYAADCFSAKKDGFVCQHKNRCACTSLASNGDKCTCKHTDKNMNWFRAAKFCKKRGGQLVDVKDLKLSGKLKGPDEDLWLGVVRSRWYFRTADNGNKPVLGDNWAKGIVEDIGKRCGTAVQVEDRIRWKPARCNESLPIICVSAYSPETTSLSKAMDRTEPPNNEAGTEKIKVIVYAIAGGFGGFIILLVCIICLVRRNYKRPRTETNTSESHLMHTDRISGVYAEIGDDNLYGLDYAVVDPSLDTVRVSKKNGNVDKVSNDRPLSNSSDVTKINPQGLAKCPALPPGRHLVGAKSNENLYTPVIKKEDRGSFVWADNDVYCKES